jgi:tight adherence protein B
MGVMNILTRFNLAGMEIQYALGLLGLFLGMCLLIGGIYYGIAEPIRKRRQIHERIQGSKREQAVRAQVFKAFQETKESVVLSLAERYLGWGKEDNLQRQLLQADIYLAPTTFVCIAILLASLGFMAGWLVGIWAWSLGLSLFLGVLPFMVLRWKRKRKTLKIERFMPDAMELLARSLRAGHTLQGTLDLVSQEIPPPLGTEMRITFEEQKLGLSMPQAFRRMGERVASQDLRYFVTAVIIQTETGGNLSEILENIGYIIRDRLKLKGKIKGLTAEGRFSALILSLLPFVTCLALYVVNRKYLMTLFQDPLGLKLLTVAIVSILIGIFIMKRMVTIKV